MKKSYLTIIFPVFAFYIFLQANFANAGAVFNKPPVTLGLISGLVSYWSFDGPDMGTTSALDASGSGNTGWLIGGAKKSTGKIGQALNFDGSNDYVTMGDINSLDGISVLSASVWVKITACNTNLSRWSGIVGNRFPGRDGPFGLRLAASDQGADECKFDFIVRNSANSTAFARSNSVPNLQQWYFVVGTWDGSTVLIYVNGELQTTTGSLTGVSDTGTDPLRIGMARLDASEGQAGGEPFNGLIDEVRVYNRALTSDEIKRLYKIGGTAKFGVAPSTGTLKDGLVGHWSFDGQDTGTTSAVDLSGNSNTGRFINGPRKIAGKIGQAVRFDGINDYINGGAGSSLNFTGNFSLSAWIFPKSYGGVSRGRIITKVDGTGGYAWYLANDFTPSNAALRFCVNACSPVNSNNNVITLNKWQHVVITYNGSNAAFYVNGQNVGSPAFTENSISAPTAEFFIGADTITPSRNFDGTIDEIRAYNRALSAEEIKRLYNMGR